jgi:hypothetical protein
MQGHAEVWIPNLYDVPKQIDAIMRIKYPRPPRLNWDDWKIGGGFTGAHTPGYDPTDDKRNYKECKFCGGTGYRYDLPESSYDVIHNPENIYV